MKKPITISQQLDTLAESLNFDYTPETKLNDPYWEIFYLKKLYRITEKRVGYKLDIFSFTSGKWKSISLRETYNECRNLVPLFFMGILK